MFSGSCGMTSRDFKKLYTIFCVDLSDQKDKLPNSITNLSIEISRRDRGADTAAHNPRHLEIFYLVLDEHHYHLDCVKKTCVKV